MSARPVRSSRPVPVRRSRRVATVVHVDWTESSSVRVLAHALAAIERQRPEHFRVLQQLIFETAAPLSVPSQSP